MPAAAEIQASQVTGRLDAIFEFSSAALQRLQQLVVAPSIHGPGYIGVFQT
ncbi:MAG: hypothetical protein WA007_18855 [Hydrogenophaga sp.]